MGVGGSYIDDSNDLTINTGQRYSSVATYTVNTDQTTGPLHVGIHTRAELFSSGPTFTFTPVSYTLVGETFGVEQFSFVDGGVGFSVNVAAPLPTVTICRPSSSNRANCGTNVATVAGGELDFIARISPVQTTGDVTVRMAVADVSHDFLASDTTLEFTIPSGRAHSDPVPLQTQLDSGGADGAIMLTAEANAAFEYSSISLGTSGFTTVNLLDTRTISICRVANAGDRTCPAPGSLSNANEGDTVHFFVMLNKDLPDQTLPIELELTAADGDMTKLPGGVSTYTVPAPGETGVSIPSGMTAATGALSVALLDDTDSGGSVTITVAIASGVITSGITIDPDNPNGITFTVDDTDMAALPVVSFAQNSRSLTADEATPGTVTLTVEISESPASSATVGYLISGDGITADDYTDSTGGTLNFPMSSDASQVISIQIDDDLVDEVTETLTVTLDPDPLRTTNVTISTDPGADTAEVEITDDDVPALAIRADMASVTEGANAAFTVNASIAPKSDLMVALNVAQPSGSDFLVSGQDGSKSVTLPQGETSATYTVLIDNDEMDETDSTLTVTLSANDPTDPSNPEYSVGMPSEAVVMLVDNDEAPMMGDNEVYVCRVEQSTDRVCPDPAFTAEVMDGDEIHVLAAVNGVVPPETLTVPLLAIDGGGGSYIDDSNDLTINTGQRYSSVATYTVNTDQTTGPLHVGIHTRAELFSSGPTFTFTPVSYTLVGETFGVEQFSFVDGGVGFSVNVAAPLPTVTICRPSSSNRANCGTNVATVAGGELDFIARISPVQTTGDVTVRMAVADVSHDFLASDTTLEFTIPSGRAHSDPVPLQTQLDSGGADGAIMLTAEANAAFEYSSISLGTSGFTTVNLLDTRTISICRVASAGDRTCPAPGSLSNANEGDTVHFFVMLNKDLPDQTLPIELELTAADGDMTKLPGGVSTYTVPAPGETGVSIPSGMTAATGALSVALLDDTDSGGSVTITVAIASGVITSGITIDPDNPNGITFIVDDTDMAMPVVSITPGDAITEGSEATFTLTLNPAPTSTLTVSVNVADATSRVMSGEAGRFLTAETITVEVAPSDNTTKTFPVPTRSDGVYRTTGGSIRATVQAGTGYRVTTMPGDDTASVTVNNGDVPVMTLSGPRNPVSVGVNEGSPISFVLSSSIPITPGSPLPVSFLINEFPIGTTVSGGAIVGGTGFVRTEDHREGQSVLTTPTTYTVTIDPGDMGVSTVGAALGSFTTNNLTALEAEKGTRPELMNVESQAGDGYFFAEIVCTGNPDDTTDCAGSPYTFNDGSDSEFLVKINDVNNRSVSAPANMTDVREADAPIVTFSVSITDTGTTASGTVAYAITGTGTAGTDYSFIGGTGATGTLNFPAGDTSAQTLSVQILDEGNIDPNEMLTLTLSNPSNNITIASATTVVSITDNDAPANPPTLAISFDPGFC